MDIRRLGLLLALTAAITLISVVGSAKTEAGGEGEFVYIESPDDFALRGAEGRPDVEVRYKFKGGFSAKIRPGTRAQLRRMGFTVSDIPVYRPTAPSDQTPYGIEQIYDDPDITETSGGDGIVIGHLDTGVDVDHPDLANRIVGCKDATDATAINVDPSDISLPDGCDDWEGHGTHTAGTALADGGPDGDGIYGVAPGANLYSIKVCMPTDDGGTCLADSIAAAIHYLGVNGYADVVTMSIGGNTESELIKEAIADYPDMLFIASAGNDGPRRNTIDYPAWDPNVVAVGAIDDSKRVTDFSSRGVDDGDDDTISTGEIEFVAAGYDVLSTFLDGEYAYYVGTSQAAPHVAGLAAREWQDDAASTRTYLRSTAEDITSGRHAGPGYDVASGYGLPHVSSLAPPTLESVSVTPENASIMVGETQSYTAMAHYSDGSTEDVTGDADWHTSDASVADFTEPGKAAGMSEGEADISATFDGVVSNMSMLEVSEEAPPSDTLHIADLDAKTKAGRILWKAQVRVTVHDANGEPVRRARVYGDWSLNGDDDGDLETRRSRRLRDVLLGSTSCRTDRDGTCTMRSPMLLKVIDAVYFEVENVRHRTLTYDPSANDDPDGDSDGTVIKISRPD